jgi:hypothetical protein
MVYFRAQHSSWYQVPVLYGWWDLSAHGALGADIAISGNGANGHTNGIHTSELN